MKFLLVYLSLSISCLAVDYSELVRQEWETFKLEHKKHYDNEIEESYRLKIYMENRRIIARHNAKFAQGLVPFQLSLNPFADMLRHEFVNLRNGFKRAPRMNSTEMLRGAAFIAPANVELPESVNWIEEGAVTPIKDQGHCGSCWAFSAVGSLEGQHWRKSGKLVSLSEQNLVDCARWWYLNNGCHGGEMTHAFRYARKHGLDTEQSYPYEAKDGHCRYKSSDVGTTENTWVDIAWGNEEDLKAAVATIGPVSVAFDASLSTFMLYSKGIYDEPECTTRTDHGVLIVGYGTEDGRDYWLVKNSWGEKWGDKGYFKIARNKNMCGIATDASYPVV